MIKFKAKISGLSQVLKQVEAYSKNMADEIDNELSVAAQNVASRAAVYAPVGRTGALGGFINADTSKRFDKTITAHAPYAAYVEFGTGSRVFEANSGFMFTPEMKEFAREFYVNGMGRMPASPFMFPALEIERMDLVKSIRAVLLKGVRI